MVQRMTSEGTENLSVLAKEKVSILSKTRLRRFLEKPMVATAHVLAPSEPKNSDSREKRIINPPSTRMNFLLLAISSGEKYSRSRNSSCRYRPPSTIAAMSMGISTSMTTSQTISSGVSTVGSQYPFMHSASAPSPGFFPGDVSFCMVAPSSDPAGKRPAKPVV